MSVATEERALLVSAHSEMREIARLLLSLRGATAEYRDSSEMTDAEILTEMRDALQNARAEIVPALEHPMIKMLLKRV